MIKKSSANTSLQSLFHRESLDIQSDWPVYKQLLLLVRNLIQSGQLKPGDHMPSENELCQFFAISRTTVRQAFGKLSESGQIIRRRGQGTFVSTPKFHRTLDHLYSFTDDMLHLGYQPSSKVVVCQKHMADLEMTRKLNLPTNAEVFLLERIRFADGEPILYEKTAIPYYLCSGIEARDFRQYSLYDILQNQFGLRPAKAIESYEAVMINKDLVKQLNAPEPGIGFEIHRTAYLEDGTAFEMTSSIARSDRCIFTVELNAGKSQIHFTRQISI